MFAFVLIMLAYLIGVLPLLAGVVAVTRYKPHVVSKPRLALWFALLYPVAMILWALLILSLVLPQVPSQSASSHEWLDALLLVLALFIPPMIAGVVYGLSFRSWTIGVAPQLANIAFLAAAGLLFGPGWWVLASWLPWNITLLVVGYFVLRRRPGWRYKPGLCRKCGYDLSGHALHAVCPECGTVPYPGTLALVVPPAAPVVPVDTSFCGKCWYDRSGLRPGVKCPNCGASPE